MQLDNCGSKLILLQNKRRKKYNNKVIIAKVFMIQSWVLG